MPKTCKEWIIKKLNTNLTGKEFEVRLSNGKIADWLFERDNNCVIIEDKEKNDTSLTKAEIQLNKYYENIKNKYKNIISIAVKELKENYHDVVVFINGQKMNDHPKDNLNNLDWYFKLLTVEFDRQELIKNINNLNEELYKRNVNDNIRASFCCVILCCIAKGINISKEDSLGVIKQKVKESLQKYCVSSFGENLNKWENIEYLYKKFVIDINTKVSVIDNKMIYFIYEFINEKIWTYLKEDHRNKSYDIMSLFFTTFGKKALSNDLGQYFTPDHISDLMTELLELNINSRVLDLACGSGTFLAKCMDKMINKANNDEQKILDIKQKQIYGIEKDPNVMGLAIANMLLHKDGRSNIRNADSFKIIDEFEKYKIDRLILNPPYSQTDHKELEFLEIGLNTLVNSGIAVIILPLSCAIGQKFQNIRKRLLQKHTLKAVFTAPQELFYPIGTTTCIMVWQAHVPQENKKVYLCDWKNDGFYKKRLSKGEATMVCDFSEWIIIRNKWINDYFGSRKLGLFKEINNDTGYKESWLFEAYMEIDYTKLTDKDFVESIRKYIAYKVENGIED